MVQYLLNTVQRPGSDRSGLFHGLLQRLPEDVEVPFRHQAVLRDRPGKGHIVRNQSP